MSIQKAPEAPASEAAQVQPLATISFAQKLAGYFVAERGFRPGYPAEAEPLAKAADIVLTSQNGRWFEIVCIVDGERHPGKVMALSPTELRGIAAASYETSPKFGTLLKMRGVVRITVIEVTEDVHADARYRALAPLFKNGLMERKRLDICIVDPKLNGPYATNRDMLQFVAEVRERPPLGAEQIQSAVVKSVARRVRPYATYGLLLLLAACFSCEFVFRIGQFGPKGNVPIETLISLGGNQQSLVLRSHQWYRLWMAVVLHVGPEHILLNGFALFVAGRLLEAMIGRVHFLALFVVGGLCGSLASVFLNPPELVSVGASGAITGCFGALLVFAFRFPAGALRNRILQTSIYTLVPAVLPFLNFRPDVHIDYADHIGGIIGGLAYAGLLFVFWPNARVRPGAVFISAALIAVGVGGFAIGAVIRGANTIERVAWSGAPPALAPDFEVQRLINGAIHGADEYLYSYPRDPRAHLGRSIYLLDTGDPAGAESEAKLALDQKIAMEWLLPAITRVQALSVLAIAQGRQGHLDEAKATAAPICATKTDFQSLLVAEDVCPAASTPSQ